MSGLRDSLLDVDDPRYSRVDSSSSSRLSQLFSKEPTSLSRRSLTGLYLLLGVSLVLVIALAAALMLRPDHAEASPSHPAAASSSSTAAVFTAASSPSSASSASSASFASSPSSASSASSAPPVLSSSTGPVPPPVRPGSLADALTLAELTVHLRSLQSIAEANQGNRAVSGPGYAASVDYVADLLQSRTNFTVRREYFTVESWTVQNATLLSQDGTGEQVRWQYSLDFVAVINSGVQGLNYDNASLVLIPNGGCSEQDWRLNASSLIGSIALTERRDSNCTFSRQSQLAVISKAAGLIIRNSETDRTIFTTQSVARYTPIPVFVVTYDVGIGFMQAAQADSGFSVTMSLTLASTSPTPVANIIADTQTGDVTSTVVIGSHLDGVAAGAGINDDGSGSTANLAMALAVDRMLKQGLWTLPNRIRFMWFGAEENGLLGSRYHVHQASLPNRRPGERIEDYAVMLNYDMLGSPNGFFGVYNASQMPAGAPARAIPGSLIVSNLHYSYYQQQALPYDGTGMGGGSDYWQFMLAGIACGGQYAGSSEVKSRAMRDRYERILGPGLGGIANVAMDPCYHRNCDDFQNINQPLFLNMTKAAAFTLQSLALQPDIRGFLQYPTAA